MRALALVRVGRCIEAAGIYEAQLVHLDNRQRKWRITTRDQASECYRRLAERDVKMKETDLAKTHLGRALEILEGAMRMRLRRAGWGGSMSMLLKMRYSLLALTQTTGMPLMS